MRKSVLNHVEIYIICSDSGYLYFVGSVLTGWLVICVCVIDKSSNKSISFTVHISFLSSNPTSCDFDHSDTPVLMVDIM